MRSGCLLLILLSGSLSAASITVYTDASAWQSAVSSLPNAAIATETFDNNQINTPGLSVDSFGMDHSPAGRIENNQWMDLGYNPDPKYEQTIWTFSKPMYGLAADFNFPSPGAGLDFGLLYASACCGVAQILPSTSGFWGFVSQTPITSVDVVHGGGWGWGDTIPPCACTAQEYTMDNLEIGYDPPPAAPEPASFIFVGLGIALLMSRCRGTYGNQVPGAWRVPRVMRAAASC